MITLFRRIRQKLINSGSFTEYLLYATGEILLVVIGILLALQINNWNEDRKELEFEQYILNEIHTNLQQDQEQISQSLAYRVEAQTAIEQILASSVNSVSEEAYGEYVANLLTFERFYPIVNGYEMLKNNGLIITDENLRSLLGQYYEYEVLRVQSSLQDLEKAFIEEGQFILKDYLDELTYGEMITFKNYPNEDLESDLRQYIIIFKENHKASMAQIEHFKKANEQLTNDVQAALSNLQ